MKDKIGIRVFCVDQVVRTKFVDQCDAKKIVEEAKVLEEYIVGNAKLPEYENGLEPMREMLGEMHEMCDTLNRHNDAQSMVCCGIKDDDDSLGVKYAN